jgi:hypothetical protein
MPDSPSSSSIQIGPLSPNSPPAGSLKINRASPSSKAVTPQPPTSPPLMSVGGPNYASSFANFQASPGLATLQGQSFSSPPSSTPMSTQVSQHATMSMTNAFPTPASSVSGQMMGTGATDDLSSGEKPFASQAVSSGPESLDRSRFGHRRTDHDRHGEEFSKGGAPGLRMDATARSRMEGSSMMDLDQGPQISTGDGSLSLASLQKDIGAAFHICKTCKVSLRDFLCCPCHLACYVLDCAY